MSTTITIGRRLIPVEHVALIEPYDPATSRMQTDKDFKTRLVMVDRDSVLTEDEFGPFAEKHGFRLVTDDRIAVNPRVPFSVAAFEPMEGFTPNKPYRTRLMWRDREGQTQSKLLLSTPEAVLAIAVRGESDGAAQPTGRTGRLQTASFRPT